MQGIIFLGVIPNLFLGVGLPIQKRKKIYQIFNEKLQADEVGIDDKMTLKKTKQEKLSFVLTNLMNLLNLDVFSSVILTKHLGDLLAGLIQVVFSPIMIMTEDANAEVNHKKVIFATGYKILLNCYYYVLNHFIKN